MEEKELMWTSPSADHRARCAESGRTIRRMRADDLPLGDFDLCRDGELVAARHARRTSPGELCGTETRQDGEFERVDCNRPLYHNRPC